MMVVQLGLPEPHRAAAARLYWQAFGGKLGRVMGPTPRARAYLERIIRTDHVIVALQDGQLLGLAGFKTPVGAFADGSWPDLRAIYGRVGAAWRLALLTTLISEIDNDRFLIDGICVAESARGQGIGQALIEGLCDEARTRGYRALRLEVIDTNLRARALYERMGFRVMKHEKLGLLRHAFGFASAATMVLDLQQDAGAAAP